MNPESVDKSMKTAMVTGGGGFIGKALVRRLLAMGVDTRVVGRSRYPDLEGLPVKVYQGDIRDGKFLVQAFKGCDTVFHVAAKAGIWGSFGDYFSINVTGTRNVLAACKANNCRSLVYTSSPSVVFSGAMENISEAAPYPEKYLCHYAHTKALSEYLVLQADGLDFRTTAIRPHLVWGPEDTNLIPRLVARGRSRSLKQVGDGSNLVDISYIDNVVDAHLLAAGSLHGSAAAGGRAYFISQGEPVNLWGWINGLFERLDIPPVSRRVSFRKAYVAGLLMEAVYAVLGRDDEPAMTRFLAEQLAKPHYFSLARARQDLGYTPLVTTSEGLDRTVAWIRAGKV